MQTPSEIYQGTERRAPHLFKLQARLNVNDASPHHIVSAGVYACQDEKDRSRFTVYVVARASAASLSMDMHPDTAEALAANLIAAAAESRTRMAAVDATIAARYAAQAQAAQVPA